MSLPHSHLRRCFFHPCLKHPERYPSRLIYFTVLQEIKNNTMRKYLAIGLLMTLVETASAQEPDIYSAAWLEKGCIAITHNLKNDQWLEADGLAGIQVQLWLSGVMAGINAMSFSANPASSLTHPPDGWSGPVAAPLIVEFMKNNPNIPPESAASRVVTAWYISSHPDSKPEHKRVAKEIIDHINIGVAPTKK